MEQNYRSGIEHSIETYGVGVEDSHSPLGIESGNGSGNGIGNGNDSGLPKRRRGRPRKNEGLQGEHLVDSGAESVNESEIPYAAPKRRRRTKPGCVTWETVANNTAALCNVIAVMRGDYWQRSAQQVKPFAEPVAEALSSLPTAIIDAMNTASLPLAIVIGAWISFGDIISIEYTNAKLSIVNGQKNNAQFRSTVVANATTATAASNRNGFVQEQSASRQRPIPVSGD